MYRARRRACPSCRHPMEERPVAPDPAAPEAHVEVDECGRCGGVYLEFFDGEPIAVARSLPAPEPGPASLPTGPMLCPDCDAEMVARAYLGQGPEIPRCETCLAIFLDRDLRREMARLRLDAPPEDADEPGWLARLLSFLD